MQRQDLYDILDLVEEKRELEAIMRRHLIVPPVSNLTGMPRPRTAGDPTGKQATLVADLDAEWHKKLEELNEKIYWVEVELGSLKSEHRRLIRLRYFEGLSPASIAELTGMHVDTVKKKLQRIVKIMCDEI